MQLTFTSDFWLYNFVENKAICVFNLMYNLHEWIQSCHLYTHMATLYIFYTNDHEYNFYVVQDTFGP